MGVHPLEGILVLRGSELDRKTAWRGMGLHPLEGILVLRGSELDLGPHPVGDVREGGLGRPLGLASVFPEH